METQCLPHFRFSLCTNVSDYFQIVVLFPGTQGFREKGSQLLSCCFFYWTVVFKMSCSFRSDFILAALHITQINPCLCFLNGFWPSLSFCRLPFEAPRQTATAFFKSETGALRVKRSTFEELIVINSCSFGSDVVSRRLPESLPKPSVAQS